MSTNNESSLHKVFEGLVSVITWYITIKYLSIYVNEIVQSLHEKDNEAKEMRDKLRQLLEKFTEETT